MGEAWHCDVITGPSTVPRVFAGAAGRASGHSGQRARSAPWPQQQKNYIIWAGSGITEESAANIGASDATTYISIRFAAIYILSGFGPLSHSLSMRTLLCFGYHGWMHNDVLHCRPFWRLAYMYVRNGPSGPLGLQFSTAAL